jgi:hypothetical protein
MLFTSNPFAPCQRREIRNRLQNRQEKIGTLFFAAAKKILTEKSKSTFTQAA